MTTKQQLAKAMHKGRIEWAKGEQQDYEMGKNLQKSYTHIFLSTPTKNEYSKAREVINKFDQKYLLEFDTLFKIYKLQNYYLPIKVFHGTTYKYKSLSTFKSVIGRVTKGNSTSNDDLRFKALKEFIQEVMVFSSPFPLVYDDLKSKKTYDVFSLLKSGVLTQEEKDFILSPISPKRIRKEKEKEMKKFARTMYTKEQKHLLYSTIVDNYKHGCNYVMSLLKKKVPCNIKTIQNYVLTCNRLEHGLPAQKTMPKLLVDLWQNTYALDKKLKNTKDTAILHQLDTVTEKQYLVVQDNKIILASDNKEYLKGFRDCAKANNLSIDWKIYEVKLIED